MTVNNKIVKRKNIKTKALAFLLILIILPLIFNTPLFTMFNNYGDKSYNEKYPDRENPLLSSNHPNNANDYKFYKELTIDHTKVSGAANLIDFPVLISILDSDLHDKAQSDADDIAFAIDFEWLDHEIELFNQSYNSTHAQLVAWVRVPILSPSVDTILRMYYGNPYIDSRENPEGVWDSNYKAVYHLVEDPSGTVYDSTSNNIDLTGADMDSADSVSAKIGNGVNFDGDPEGLESSASLTISDFTLQCWGSMDSYSGFPTLIGIANSENRDMLFDGSYFTFYDGDYDYHLVSGVSGSAWRQLAITYTGGTVTGYVDGSTGTDSVSLSSLTGDVTLGFDGSDNSNYINGRLDEVRISDCVRSTDWIKTEYNNQFNANSFYNISTEVKDFIPSINDFEYFKEIVIDHTKVSGSSDLINFPLLISILDSGLHDYAQPDGDDIAFNNGTSWLFHEIEFFNQNYNITHAQLIAWVKIPKLSPSNDTIIRMYFGNSTINSQQNPIRVWDDNYCGVYHLSEDPTGTIYDSTYNNKDGISGGSMTSDDQVEGKIDGSLDFDGSNDYINIDSIVDEMNPNRGTYALWIYRKFLDTVGLNQWALTARKDSDNRVTFSYMYDSDVWRFRHEGNNDETNLERPPNEIPQNEWIYVAMSWDTTADELKAYIEGNQVGSTLTGLGTCGALTSARIAGEPALSGKFEGIIDEIHISNIPRSSDWIKTEYNNQKDPNSFYTIGNAIKVDENAPPDASYFNYYKVITIDSLLVYGSGYHSNFPVLISLFDSDLHSDVQEDGDDIAFSLGSYWLDHEIEVFNKSYNETCAQLVVWVRVPQLSTSLDTYIRMYYGNFTMSSRENPTGVWDGSYKGVWHLAETEGVTQDSTSYNEIGIVSGTITRPSTGQIGNAYNYGTGGTFTVLDPADEHLDFGTQSFMVSMWINIDTSTGASQTPLYKGGYSTYDAGYCFATPMTGDTLSFQITDENTNSIGSSSASITFDHWIYIVGCVDRKNDLLRIYKDGYEVGSGVDISAIVSTSGIQNFRCANPLHYFDGLLDEIRVLNGTRSKNWIKNEYLNQYNPNSFYSIGLEQGIARVLYSNLQVNAIDLYGNSIPYVNVSIYNQTKLIKSKYTDSSGTTLLLNIVQGEYNFTGSITSDIGNHIEVVNITSEAIVINQSFQIVDLICDVGSNFFEIVDIDGIFVDSGWIIVGNSTHELQNCSIDGSGHARFWWVNTTPYQYNYTVYYQDDNYNPNLIQVASGDINTVNASIQVQVSLTTVNFYIQTLISKQPVGGVKLLLTATNTGKSIVNLTTDKDGKTTLRWLNSTGINGNYSLELEFFGTSRMFNMTSITKTLVTEANFTVSSTEDFYIYIEVTLENYETELISLNPSEYISVEWGSQLKLRILFNVSKAIGAEHLLGPTYSDIMTYQIFKGADLIHSANLDIEKDYTGTHSSLINTENLESDVTYLIFVSAQKSGYSIPQELLLQLGILENTLILNQSQNDDSIASVYWSDNIDFSLKAYGELSETFTTETSIFQSIDHNFRFSLPNINSHWNLSQITFNIFNISWNVNASDINLTILDPFGVNRVFNISNHAGWDYNLGTWTGIIINLNKGSPTFDNNFEFFISGTFDNTIDVIADVSFIRNGINAQYVKFNVSDTISITSESEGWVIKNITFIIQNCYNTLTWQKVNLSTLTNLNISTADGFKYSLHSGDANGNGELIIDDSIIYPTDNQFLFVVETNPNIIFDAIITVEYIQYFYQNRYLETLNISDIQQNIPNGGTYQLSVTDSNWDENYAVLLINGINNKTQPFSPSELAMNITIGGQTYSVLNTLPGQGLFSLNGFNKDSLYTAVIETNQPVNFTLSFRIKYSRTVVYETLGTVTYFIRESPDIYGSVTYYTGLGCYLQTIDTSLIDADYYTINFQVNKEHYYTAMKDLDFIVMNRLTLLNGEAKLFRELEFIYVKDNVNFTFLYTDALTGARITDLTTQYYRWEKYDSYGNVTATGEGSLLYMFDDSYILDFNSQIRDVGDYLLIVTVDKDNYDYKNALILLTIKTRFLEYSLSSNFRNFQTSIVQGKTVHIRLNLTDPTRGGTPLLNATINLTISDDVYNFEELGNGIYILDFHTANINAFFTSNTLLGIINITKDDYFSEAFSISLVVEMEQIFPGMPTFYFLIIIFAILATVGSIVGYRVYKHATIPTFVKNVREMKKEIKGGKAISESLLYHAKEVFVGEIVRDKWSTIGLSLGDILNIEIKKSKKLLKSKRSKPKKTHDLKPLGLLVMRWDERIGVELLVKYPKDTDISDKTLMQIYSTHEYSGERGLINLTYGTINALSYYTGPEFGYYIILLLNLDDDPDIYEGVLPNITQIILQNLEDDMYLPMIPSFFQRLSVYPSLTDEQNLIFYYQDEIKRMIINILRDYGVIIKSELIIWVRERELESIVDLEAVLAELIKSELIKVGSVKGIPSELIFLMRDIFMLRVPPEKLFKDPVNHGLPPQLTKEYQDEVQKFFNEYHPTEEDTLKLLNCLIDPEVYETLRLLRTAIVTMKDFEKLKSKGVSDIYGVLKKLYDINMIKVFKDENELEYYTLLTDFYIDTIFPKYLLNVVKLSYEQKSKTDTVLQEYLNLLEETYTNLKSKQ